MSNEAEEWADGAKDFFNEFASFVSQVKSQRRMNVEAHKTDMIQKQNKAERREVDRAESAAEARRRITAAVLRRASAKEIEAAARNAKKHPQKVNAMNKQNSSASEGSTDSFAGLPGISACSTSLLYMAGKGNEPSSVKPRMDGEPTGITFGKKRVKVDAKFARKAARKEEGKESRIKYRRTVRKQRR